MQDKKWEVARAGEPREPTRFPLFVLHRDLGSRGRGMAHFGPFHLDPEPGPSALA